MSEYFEDPPLETPGDRFSPPDWLDPKDAKELVHMERDGTLQFIRKEIARLQPLLEQQDGVCLFRTYQEGEESTILVTNLELAPSRLGTTIVINKYRPTTPDEPFQIEGQALELCDLFVDDNTRWFDGGNEILYRPRHEHTWERPHFTTLLYKRFDYVQLFGALSEKAALPTPAEDTESVQLFAEYYWYALDALKKCNTVNLEESIHTLR